MGRTGPVGSRPGGTNGTGGPGRRIGRVGTENRQHQIVFETKTRRKDSTRLVEYPHAIKFRKEENSFTAKRRARHGTRARARHARRAPRAGGLFPVRKSSHGNNVASRPHAASPRLARPLARTHARTKRIRFPGWTHSPNLRCIYSTFSFVVRSVGGSPCKHATPQCPIPYQTVDWPIMYCFTVVEGCLKRL